MKLQKVLILLTCVCTWTTCVHAQVSIRAGVNLADEVKKISDEIPTYQSEMLNAFNIGIMYQFLSAKGLGGETGVVFSQKGSNFSYTDDADETIRGFSEVGYVEIPLNIKYVFRVGVLGIYVAAGVYGSCSVYGKTTLESITETGTPVQYDNFKNRLDAGYNAGGGIELFKQIQLGVNWSQSFFGQTVTETILPDTPIQHQNSNKVLAVNLTYFF